MTMCINAFAGKRGIRYVGQYRPKQPYPLSEDLFIVPADWGMFPYGSGAEVRLNVSYFVSAKGLDDEALTKAFREWLVFDSFILADGFPIHYYDESVIGAVENVPDDIAALSAETQDHQQIDYSDVAAKAFQAMGDRQGLPVLSYGELLKRYQELDTDRREMIEWFVSAPHRSHHAPEPFFNINYWQLVHLTILLERMIGLPPNCEGAFGACPKCCKQPPPPSHHSMTRKDWLKCFLAERIADGKLVSEYAELIETAKGVRDEMVHVPLFDRSTMPDLARGETQVYGTKRTTDEWKEDRAALLSLVTGLSTVCRYLLMDMVFNVRSYRSIRPLKVTQIGG
jgi:hypothetical protein